MALSADVTNAELEPHISAADIGRHLVVYAKIGKVNISFLSCVADLRSVVIRRVYLLSFRGVACKVSVLIKVAAIVTWVCHLCLETTHIRVVD